VGILLLTLYRLRAAAEDQVGQLEQACRLMWETRKTPAPAVPITVTMAEPAEEVSGDKAEAAGEVEALGVQRQGLLPAAVAADLMQMGPTGLPDLQSFLFEI
jgi:hypothetical protein